LTPRSLVRVEAAPPYQFHRADRLVQAGFLVTSRRRFRRYARRFANGDNGAADTEPGHPGDYIPGAANMIATASATVEDLGPCFGALRFRYFGRRPLIEDNSVTSKPTTLVDLRIGYKLADIWRRTGSVGSRAEGGGAPRVR
jgi:hypothetical protein